MRFSPVSFALGLAVASIIPALSRVFRPFAVEAAAAGLGMLDDARRFTSEQIEALEDIVAEAKARREHLDEAAVAASAMTEAEAEEAERPGAAVPPRRRTNGGGRRRSVGTER
jgi:hypothetical protein